MFEILKKSIRYILCSNWYDLLIGGGLIITNMTSYLLKFIAYESLMRFISGVNDNVDLIPNIEMNLVKYFLLFITIHLSYNTSFYYLEKIVLNGVKRIFVDLTNRIMNYHVDFFKKNNNSKISQIWFYLSSIEMLVEKLILELPRILIFIGYYLYSLYSFSPIALFIILPINILITLLLHPLSIKQYQYQQDRIDLDLDTKNKLLEATANIEFVKLNNKQLYESDRVLESYNQYVTNKLADKKISSSITTFSEMFSDILVLIVYSIGVLSLINNNLKPIELLYIAVNTSNFYYQITQLKDIYNFYRRIYPKIQIIYDITVYQPLENIQLKNSDYNQLDNKDIIFHNVSFSYDPSRIILKNISFKLVHNQINLLLGPNGSGKSTIIKLLLRLYELEESDNKNIIYYSGKNIKSMSLEELRNSITFVAQEPAIFNDTVWNNLTYGIEHISETQILNNCALLDSKEWIVEQKNKIAGFRGKELSGGEKKKIQLINSISRNTDVIIFDEPTNALDSNALKWFIGFVKKIKEDYKKTVIIITHDTRLTDVVDNVVTL